MAAWSPIRKKSRGPARFLSGCGISNRNEMARSFVYLCAPLCPAAPLLRPRFLAKPPSHELSIPRMSLRYTTRHSARGTPLLPLLNGRTPDTSYYLYSSRKVTLKLQIRAISVITNPSIHTTRAHESLSKPRYISRASAWAPLTVHSALGHAHGGIIRRSSVEIASTAGFGAVCHVHQCVGSSGIKSLLLPLREAFKYARRTCKHGRAAVRL